MFSRMSHDNPAYCFLALLFSVWGFSRKTVPVNGWSRKRPGSKSRACFYFSLEIGVIHDTYAPEPSCILSNLMTSSFIASCSLAILYEANDH